jgi:hypothetical protein
MDAVELINDLRVSLDEVKSQGNATIPVAGLETYLAEMERIASVSQAELIEANQREQARHKFEHDFEVWKVSAPLQNANSVEMFKSVIEAGQTALKSATLINGAAAIALLAFLGNLLTKTVPGGVAFPIPAINYAMFVFVCGVGFAGIATGIRYLAQFAYSSNWYRLGHTLNLISNVLAAASFCAFFWGGYKAYMALGG